MGTSVQMAVSVLRGLEKEGIRHALLPPGLPEKAKETLPIKKNARVLSKSFEA